MGDSYDPSHLVCSVEGASRNNRCTQRSVCALMCSPDARRRPMFWESSCGGRALRHTKDTSALQKRKKNPNRAVVIMCARSSPDSPTLCHSLALRGMCGRKEGQTDDEESGVGWGVFPGDRVSFTLFGEFADDTDQCSIFIFQTLVVCFQVNQSLEKKKKKNKLLNRHISLQL